VIRQNSIEWPLLKLEQDKNHQFEIWQHFLYDAIFFCVQPKVVLKFPWQPETTLSTLDPIVWEAVLSRKYGFVCADLCSIGLLSVSFCCCCCCFLFLFLLLLFWRVLYLTCLLLACCGSHHEIMKLLLDKRVGIDWSDDLT